jgi:hypothetical protein
MESGTGFIVFQFLDFLNGNYYGGATFAAPSELKDAVGGHSPHMMWNDYSLLEFLGMLVLEASGSPWRFVIDRNGENSWSFKVARVMDASDISKTLGISLDKIRKHFSTLVVLERNE